MTSKDFNTCVATAVVVVCVVLPFLISCMLSEPRLVWRCLRRRDFYTLVKHALEVYVNNGP